MRFLPLLEREVRAESRQAINYWMRVGCAMAVLLAMMAWISSNPGGVVENGRRLFGVVQSTLFSLIWLLGAVFTCDSISRERREGTLGLLMLTSVRPMDIALSKAMSGVVRTATVMLASLPVLSVPILMGGLSGPDLLRAVTMDVMALFASVSAGLIASARCREFSRSVVCALLVSFCFLTLLGGTVIAMQIWRIPPSLDAYILAFLLGPWVYCSGFHHVLQGSLPGMHLGIHWVDGVQVLLSVLILFATLAYLNRVLPRLSAEAGRTRRQQWWWNLFFKPTMFTQFLKASQAALLNRNPIGWLHRRTLSARLSMWCWLGFVTMILSVTLVVGIRWEHVLTAFSLIMLGLCPALAFSSADSFRRERETGAFELLLVTGITPDQLLRGRLFGIWGQYTLVMVLLSLLWFRSMDAVSIHNGMAGSAMAVWILFVVAFVCIPVIGLNQSLHRTHFFSALATTMTLGLAIPIGIPLFVLNLIGSGFGPRAPFVRGYGTLVAMACLASGYLLYRLARRSWRQALLNLTERRFLQTPRPSRH